MHRFLAIILLLGVALDIPLVPLARAQFAPAGCAESRDTAACRTGMRELYRLASLEAHRDDKDQLRRVFYVDGYDNDLIAISFLRSPGHDPIAYVHFPYRRGSSAARPLVAVIPHDVWTEILTRSTYFERELVPVSETAADICLHAWSFTVEANDPPRSNGDVAPFRRKTDGGCGDNPVRSFAIHAQEAALSLFPYCSRIDPGIHRSAVERLKACSLLAGDRLAAAEAFNRLAMLDRVRGPGDARSLADLFTRDANVEWNGIRSPGNDAIAIADFWLDRTDGPDGGMFRAERIEGLAADRAHVAGHLARFVDEPGGRSAFYRAPVELTLSLTGVQRFQIIDAKVGASVRVSD